MVISNTQQFFVYVCSYEEWSNNDGHEASTQQEERTMPQLPLAGSKTKVNRSQSFSDTGAGAGLSMNMLLPPDPR